MKQKLTHLLLALLCAAFTAEVRAQVTAFTYQGRLNLNGSPANGSYDFQFRLYDDATNGDQVPIIPVATGVLVSNGVFTTGMDFGDVFHGAPQWLEIAVQPHNGPGFVTLLPRQLITPAPYATFANSASNLSGTLPATQLSGTVPNAQLSASVSLLGTNVDSSEIADGTITTNDLNASVLNGTFWKLGGNTGASPTDGIFLGTTDNQPLEFKVNGLRGLRLQPAGNVGTEPPSLVGGYGGNSIDQESGGSVILGGGTSGSVNSISDGSDFSTIAGGYANSLASGSQRSFIGGGNGNSMTGASQSFIGGGFANQMTGVWSMIGGGYQNSLSADQGVIAGGRSQLIENGSVWSAIGGGRQNRIFDFANYAVIPGGFSNAVTANYSFAAGRRANANHDGTFVWADSTDADFASTGNNQFLIRASGGVGINTSDPAGAALRVVGSIKADSYLGMGSTLTLGTTDNQPLEFEVNGQRGLRLEYADNGIYQGVSVIGGYRSNFVAGGVVGATISGGGSAGESNQVTGDFGTVGGGVANTSGQYAVVGGGSANTADFLATVGGGIDNHANGYYSAIGGGSENQAGGSLATVPGGNRNFANGDLSFAAGDHAKANHTGTFVWADATGGLLGPDFASTANNQFLIRASGGVAIGTNDPAGAALRVAGQIAADSLRAPGAGINTGTFAFTHRATAGSIFAHITTIDNAVCNGDPNAILIVTHNWSKDTSANQYHPQAVGVYYDGAHWAIFHEDDATPMEVGDAFNVMVIKP